MINKFFELLEKDNNKKDPNYFSNTLNYLNINLEKSSLIKLIDLADKYPLTDNDFNFLNPYIHDNYKIIENYQFESDKINKNIGKINF